MINYSKADLLFGKKIKVSDNVFIKVPTVEDVMYESNYGLYTTPLTTSTRELFSGLKEVDKYEDAFPNVWLMIFHPEGDLILGQMLGGISGKNITIEAISYWLGLEKEDFRPLSNSKIINEKAGLVIDEKLFNQICEVVKGIVCYEPNRDLIAPRGMSDRKADIWEKTYKGRLRGMQKGSKSIVDKILILSVSMDSYIPLETIKNMTIFNFTKTFELISNKESYEKQWQLKLSPKFETKNGEASTHWKEKFKA